MIPKKIKKIFIKYYPPNIKLEDKIKGLKSVEKNAVWHSITSFKY
jgi:hypothetical protein